MKKKILAMFLSLCIVIGLMPTGAMAALEDGSQVVRVQDTDAWYSDATKAFRTKNSYWFDQIKSQPDGYAVDATKKTVTISAPEALVWWAKQVNQGTSFEGYTVYIMADLDMSAHYWTPICTGKYEKNSEGKWVVTENSVLDNTTICGNGHTITGLATSTGLRGPNQNSQPGDGSNCYYDAAFIGYSCCDIKICDLAFDGARIAITEPFDEVTTKYGSSMVAVVVGAQNKGSLTLNNVTVNDADVLAMQKASAFVGNLMGNSTLTVNKCAVTNSTFSAYFMVAPIASYGATTQVKVNGIQLKNNTINVVEQASQTYSYDETMRAEYWGDDLNASTTTVFYDTTMPLVSVAELDGYGFVNLGDAITAAETGDTITLLSDVAVDTTITVDKNVTINLNGYTITGVSRSGDSAIGRRVFYVTKGTLNLTGEGTVTTADKNDETFKDSSSVIRVGDGSDYAKTESLETAGLVIGSDVTISAPASYGVGAFGGDTKETLDVYGKVISTSSASAVSGNGQDINSDTTINIHDGAVITAEKAVAIYHPQAGAMTIGAATITGTGGIEAKAGSTTVTVDGATITATGEVDHTANSDGTSTDGYAIAAVENDDYAGNATIRIENGHFIGPVAVLTDNPVVENKDATIEISGGNFSEPVNKEYLADAISAELYSLRNTATPYSYYPSVEEAQAAAQPGDVVTDLSTVTENAKKFTVVFDYGNGTKKELTMPEGANASLPSLNDRGYNHFQGWNDGTTTYAGGTKVTISKDTTFTAVWSYIPPANPNYKITIGDTANGTVTADPAAAKAGATVTLTATPDEGYTLGSLTVTDRFGDAVKVTENADGTYTFTMPNGQVTVNATFVETEEPAPTMPFTDVKEGDWFYEEVLYAYENGLMNGVGDNRFAPNSATTRGMLVTILYRLEGEPAVTGEAGFDDVGDTWYTDAVIWAAANDIVNGIGDNQFGPENTLTREQLVTMLYRYAQNKGYDVTASADLSGYPDAGQIQSWAQDAMTWAVAEGIVEGMDGNLNPAGHATRAQIATILMRFCEGVAK